ncbi:unnamed protein product [Alopecurus aequalis]
MTVSLPDEVLPEILFRLHDAPAALFRCATTCKQWRALVAELAFLRRCWPADQDTPSSSLIGFFTHEHLGHAASSTLCFTPTKRSVLGPGTRTVASIITAAPADIFDDARPLFSCHGLLLVRLKTHAKDFAVCNFLTGVCHVIPNSDFDGRKWNGYVILAGADCRSNDEEPSNSSSLFKVVILSTHENDNTKYTLHTFSSEEQSWRVRTGSIHGIGLPIRYMSSSLAVVHRGVAHWLFDFYDQELLCLGVLNLNMRTGHVSLVKLPFQINQDVNYRPCLTLAANGALSLLWRQTIGGTKMDIWEQQPNKGGGSEWVCTRTVELKLLGKRKNKGRHLRVLGQSRGTLLVHDTILRVYTADLETGTIEEVVDWPRGGSIILSEKVALESDWPAIFVSRLDTRYS